MLLAAFDELFNVVFVFFRTDGRVIFRHQILFAFRTSMTPGLRYAPPHRELHSRLPSLTTATINAFSEHRFSSTRQSRAAIRRPSSSHGRKCRANRQNVSPCSLSCTQRKFNPNRSHLLLHRNVLLRPHTIHEQYCMWDNFEKDV